ncbi:MAG: ABC transporter permease [Pacificibacter sp.]|uniref:ABC transporter permease n=1 Tax=Pacificibacter sp. TaxID=1917866 RepID=UPI00321AE35E
MFHYHRRQTGFAVGFSILKLIFNCTVRKVRQSHGSPIIGLLLAMSQTLMLVVFFSFMINVLAMRSTAIRGDFVLYIMSGIFLFITHNAAIKSVSRAESADSPMMQHAPMNTAIAISAAALSSLYIQTLSVIVILSVYFLGWGVAPVQYLPGAISMYFLSWLSGVSIGLIFWSLRPWFPQFTQITSTIYTRANMITSGKMFLANTLPGSLLVLFSWNPLFHCIDQARGFVFVNYTPHNSSITYPIVITAILLTIGLLAQFFTRTRVSASWGAGR